MLTIAASLVATMFGLLISILGWMGNKVYSKMEEMGVTLHKIAGDLHQKIESLDRRITVVEVKQERRTKECEAHETRTNP